MKLASRPRERGAAPQSRKANQPPPGGFFYGESMTDFSIALIRLWPHGDEKIPGASRRHDRQRTSGVRQVMRITRKCLEL
jgi:hypothetical protein